MTGLNHVWTGLMNLGQIATRLEKSIHGEIAVGGSGHPFPKKKRHWRIGVDPNGKPL